MDFLWCWSHYIVGILYESHHHHYQAMIYGHHDYSQWSDGQNADFALFKVIIPTNLDINDAACLHVVHIVQHPTSCPTTRSSQDTMVNAPKMNSLPLPSGKCGQSTKQSTRRGHQADVAKSCSDAGWVHALGALRSLRSTKKLSWVKRREMLCLSNEEKEKWIHDYVDIETAVAPKWVQSAETAIMQEQ